MVGEDPVYLYMNEANVFLCWGGAPNHNIVQFVHMFVLNTKQYVLWFTSIQDSNAWIDTARRGLKIRDPSPPLPTYTCVGRRWHCSFDKMNLDVLERTVNIGDLLQKLQACIFTQM